MQSIESLPVEESSSSEPRFWKGFRPGKMLDLAASPNGRWLAVSFGHSVKIYSVMMVMSASCSPDMSNAVVRMLIATVLLSIQDFERVPQVYPAACRRLD